MDTVAERPKVRRNIFWPSRPANEAFHDYLDRRVPDDGADALPSMFHRSRTATAASKPHAINRRGGFPTYVIILFLFAVAQLQAALLTSEDGSIGQVLALIQRSAAEIGTLFSVPSAEAAISSQSQSLAPAGAAPAQDHRWSEAVDAFKLLLAEQKASATKQAENERLLERLQAWVIASTEKPAKVAGACVLNCWKTATFIR